MLRIRLRRTGKKKQPSYRVVVADSRAPRDGRFVETIGFYNPRTDPPTFRIDEERALYWLSQGAKPSEPVARLLEKQGTLERFARLKAGEDLESLLAEAAEQRRAAEEAAIEVEKAPPEEAPEAEEAAIEAEETPAEEVAPEAGEASAEEAIEAEEASAEEEASTEAG